jgi:hypothetical protein
VTRLPVRCLAAWRLTELVVEDEITRPVRETVQRRWPGSKLNYMVGCKRCVSVWAAAATLILPEWACTVLAASSVTILADAALNQASRVVLTRRMAAGGATGREGETR